MEKILVGTDAAFSPRGCIDLQPRRGASTAFVPFVRFRPWARCVRLTVFAHTGLVVSSLGVETVPPFIPDWQAEELAERSTSHPRESRWR